MRHFESSLPFLALLAEVIGGLAVIFGLLKWLISLLRPITVSTELSGDQLNVLAKIRIYGPERVSLGDAGISISKRRLGIQVRESFLGLGIGKDKLTFARMEKKELLKGDGRSTVASQSLSMVKDVATQMEKNLAPPIWPYVCYRGSRMTVGRRIRLSN